MNGRVRCWICLGTLAAMGAAALPAGDAPSTAPGDLPEQLRESMRALWRMHVAPLCPDGGVSALAEYVRRLRMIQLASKEGPASRAPTSRPADTLAQLDQAPPVGPWPETISPETLTRLQKLPAQGIVNPEELAGALFRSGHFDAAYVFYEHALKEATQPEDKDWLLYQMANCRREVDPAAAAGLYKRLIAESPDSLWSALADAHVRLIQWRQINAPRQLVKEVNDKMAAGNGTTTRPSPGEQVSRKG